MNILSMIETQFYMSFKLKHESKRMVLSTSQRGECIYQLKMISGKPKQPPNTTMNHSRTKESKISSLNPFNNLFYLHLTWRDINDDIWVSSFEVLSIKIQSKFENSRMATSLINKTSTIQSINLFKAIYLGISSMESKILSLFGMLFNTLLCLNFESASMILFLHY